MSYNFCADNNSIIQTVECDDSPWAAGSRAGNNRGIHYGLAGFASQTSAQWLDQYSRDMLMVCRPIVLEDQARFDIPTRQCSIADLIARRKGHTTHNDLRIAFGGTTHTDPGPNFPWAYLFALLVEDEPEVEGHSMAIVFSWGGKIRMGFGPDQGYKTMLNAGMYSQWRSAYADPPCYPEKNADGYPTQTLEERGWTASEVETIYGYDMDDKPAPVPPDGLVPHHHGGTLTTGPAIADG